MELANARFKAHALAQMSLRGITEADVRVVLARPEAIVNVRPNRVVAQAVVGEHLLRVFVDIDRDPPEVVTAYRTSQIEKYRSNP